MKELLIRRVAELGMACEQALSTYNTIRGQKIEAEACLNHFLKHEEAEKNAVHDEPQIQ